MTKYLTCLYLLPCQSVIIIPYCLYKVLTRSRWAVRAEDSYSGCKHFSTGCLRIFMSPCSLGCRLSCFKANCVGFLSSGYATVSVQCLFMRYRPELSLIFITQVLQVPAVKLQCTRYYSLGGFLFSIFRCSANKHASRSLKHVCQRYTDRSRQN